MFIISRNVGKTEVEIIAIFIIVIFRLVVKN